MKKLAPFAVSLLVLAAGCGTQEDTDRYTAALRPVNDSGSEGTARLTLDKDDGDFDVRFNVSGMTPDEIHKAALYGVGNRNAECPTTATAQTDENRDGVLEVGEASRQLGGRLFPLRPAPTVGSDGELDVFLPYEFDEDQIEKLDPLDGRLLVLFGKRANTRGRFGQGYDPDLPTACGRIAKG